MVSALIALLHRQYTLLITSSTWGNITYTVSMWLSCHTMTLFLRLAIIFNIFVYYMDINFVMRDVGEGVFCMWLDYFVNNFQPFYFTVILINKDLLLLFVLICGSVFFSDAALPHIKSYSLL